MTQATIKTLQDMGASRWTRQPRQALHQEHRAGQGDVNSPDYKQ